MKKEITIFRNNCERCGGRRYRDGCVLSLCGRARVLLRYKGTEEVYLLNCCVPEIEFIYMVRREEENSVCL